MEIEMENDYIINPSIFKNDYYNKISLNKYVK